MTTITIKDGSTKSVQSGDKLIFDDNYLSDENNGESLIASFDGGGNPQCNVIPQGGGSTLLVSVAQNRVVEVWRKL